MRSTPAKDNKKKHTSDSWIIQVAHEVCIDQANVSTCAVFESKSRKIIALDVAREYNFDKTKTLLMRIFLAEGLPKEIHIKYNSFPEIMELQKWCKNKDITLKFLNTFNFDINSLLQETRERIERDIN